MANHWRKIVIPVSSSTVTAITGSIYKVCSNGAAETISSASFGWQNKGVNQLDPGTPIPDLSFALHYHANAGNTCVEADFTYISCSIGTHVYLKTNGSQGWDTNVS
tara:strand:+ start:307 stop:624 length:318 start_codon:yes stop_codon:yes gene_type:complete